MTGNPSPEEARRAVAAKPDWYHRIEVAPGVVTPGINDTPYTLSQLELPEDCSGLRALDIGARDGFFSFELERRGADVLAMDFLSPEKTGFSIASGLLGSSVEYVIDNVYNLSPAKYGEFDIVLFLGVLYHLRNPLQALDVIWEVCRGDLYVETQLLDNQFRASDGSMRELGEVDPEMTKVPLMQFYPGSTLNGDFTNWWAPNGAALEAMLDAAGFDVDYMKVLGTRGVARGRKTEDPMRLYHRDVDSAADLKLAPPPS
jgi:tRNA (mo5U34)-methyltransferase